jgi:hypothetical protein
MAVVLPQEREEQGGEVTNDDLADKIDDLKWYMSQCFDLVRLKLIEMEKRLSGPKRPDPIEWDKGGAAIALAWAKNQERYGQGAK